MNSFIFTGRLTKDITVEKRGNVDVANFSIAVDRGKDKEGRDKGADFIMITAFNSIATSAERYVGKGCKILVTGHVSTGSYEKDGKTNYTTSFIAETIEYLEWKDSKGKAAAPAASPAPVAAPAPAPAAPAAPETAHATCANDDDAPW